MESQIHQISVYNNFKSESSDTKTEAIAKTSILTEMCNGKSEKSFRIVYKKGMAKDSSE